MKKFKLNYLQIFILLFSASIIMTGCYNDDSEIQVERSISKNLNTPENRKSISDLFTAGTSSNNLLEKYIVESSKNSDFKISNQDIESAINNYQNCSDCTSEYKEFMIPLIREISKTDDRELLDVIWEYQTKIDTYNADYTTKQNLEFILFSFSEVTSYNLNKFESANQKSSDNKVATGLAWGFLAGCATGAYIGATAGTVTVPIIGTVTGAVAGCVAGGAWSATIGAAGGAFWEIFD